MYNPFTLTGKNILITGASSGIGRAIAVACSKMGAKMIITGRNQSRISETWMMLDGNGHQYIVADLTMSEDLKNLVSSLPKLDGIVYNAGVGSRVPCRQIQEQEIDKVFNLNTKSPILLQTEILSKKLLNTNSSIVFLASKAAEFPSVGNAVYSASKGAVISYSKVLALELAPRNIRVNCICPAMVWTELILQEGMSREIFETSQKKYPLKRYGTPEDIAHLAIYLLSDASSWMTGSCLDITGGGEGTLT